MINLNLIYAMIAPLLLLAIIYFFFVNKEKETVFKGIMCFFIGMLMVLPAASFENYFIPEQLPINIYGTMISNFLFVGFIEEFLKLVIGYYAVKTLLVKNRNANTFMFLLFSVGVGFSFMENIIYVYNSGFDTALLRSFSSIPMHGATALIIGYFGYLEYSSKIKLGWVKGLVIAIVLHGIYNTYAVEFNHSYWFYGIFVISFIYIVTSVLLLFFSKKNSQPEGEETILIKNLEKNIIED